MFPKTTPHLISMAPYGDKNIYSNASRNSSNHLFFCLLDIWRGERRWKWNKTEVQYCELFSGMAKISLLAHFGRLTDVANHFAVNLCTVSELKNYEKFVYLQWELIFTWGLLFLSSLHSRSKNISGKKKKGCICYPTRLRGHCVAISLSLSLSVGLSHSFKFCPDSNLFFESVPLITGGNTFVRVPYKSCT